MRTALIIGAILLVAGVAGLIIVPEHAPGFAGVCGPTLSGGRACHAVGLSRPLYDALRIASFACLIVGAISVLYGLSISLRRPVKA